MISNISGWKFRYKAATVLVLASGSILGVSSAASASATSVTAVATSPVGSPAAAPTPLFTETMPASSPDATTAPAGGDRQQARAPSSLINKAVSLIKKLPGWWSKFSSGVKKAFSWFNSQVWKPICAIANAIQIFVTGWDIWNWFH
jgi:hypothetical protein